MTRRLMRSCAAALLAAAGVAGGLSAAPFVPPVEDVVVFRRDRLTLDVDSMEALAAQLLILAKAQGGAGEADRRGVAQMLALARALNPGDDQVWKFGERYAEGKQLAMTDPRTVANVRARVWQTLGWLESADAGEDAKSLAHCLGDVMALADPQHPRAKDLRKRGERGAWAGWVKPLAAFKVSAPVVRTPTQTAEDDPLGIPSPEPDESAEPTASIKLPKATLGTVVWAAPDSNKPRTLIVMDLAMEATLKGSEPENGGNGKDGDQPQPPSFSCKWVNPKADSPRNEETKAFNPTSNAARAIVEKHLGPMPADVHMSFSPDTPSIYRMAKDPTGVSGALAVLMNAARTGIEPQGIVLGNIQADGSFRLPTDFWGRLRFLPATARGGRLVVPAEAEPFLSAVLALEDPGFFLDYEVLYAADFAQLVERTARVSKDGLTDATARFAEIRDKRGNQNVSGYVGNRFVRTRLEEIVRSAPYHASARMLTIQGAGQRPTRLETRILAHELLTITRATDWVAKLTDELDKLDSGALNELAEKGREGVKSMERYAEMRDQALVAQTNDLMMGLRTFSRALRKRTDVAGKWIDHRGDLNTFKQLHQRVTTQLKLVAGMDP
ncbi:MAG: hypothetical protein K9N23_12760 [Akkermansiaceae bacterium]|nr:hypothetical protein [Akkermansiaceae bacterium]MCF7732555.1 hypothetical protein [Akkermansiaceae bacterium]